jgi:hypothetical protein
MVNLDLPDRVGEKIKDGRHVGLDFYDPLIEGVQRDLGGCAPVLSSHCEKGLGSVYIAVSGKEEIDTLSGLVHGPIQVDPAAPTFTYVLSLLQDPPTGRAYRLQRFSNSGR